jgi:large subunit ribosomal protein L25
MVGDLADRQHEGDDTVAEIQSIAADKRERAGKGSSRAARREGFTPAVIYGGSQPPEMINVNANDLWLKYIRGGFTNTLFKIEIGGQTEQVLPRDVQLHPVTDRILHVDFLRVGANTRIAIEVPVHFDNLEQSPGIKRGGVLNVVRHEVELWCPAGSIPERLNIDLTGLEIGDGVHINDIALPEGAEPVIQDRNFTIATIAAPSTGEKEIPEGAEGEEAEGAEAVAEEAEGGEKED